MTKWEQLAALLTGGNKPNPLFGMMAAQNPLYTADPTQTVDAARAFSQGMSSAAIGSIPGSGVVNAAGIQPRYDENWFIPAGITQGPNIRENLQSGNYLDAGLQGLGILGDAASVGAMASMVPKSAQRGVINLADDLPMDEASRMARADKYFPIDVYHGANRLDRLLEKPYLDKSRATSGPMAFMTDAPPLASKYALDKADTSIDAPDYGHWFKINDQPFDKAWWTLTPSKRQEITNNLAKIGYTDDEYTKIGLTDSNVAGAGKDHWDYTLRAHKGNALAAAKDLWLDSGQLFNQEDKFNEVVKLAGLENVKYDNPNAQYPGVFVGRLRMEKPFETTQENVASILNELKQAEPKRKKFNISGVDGWDKNGPRGAAFVSQLENDLKNGTTYAWTSIPDWVTKFLKSKGYDGIKDVGGKMGGDPHTVYIPFEPNQVRSRFAKFDPAKINSKDLLAGTLPLGFSGMFGADYFMNGEK